jgi:hypothetical protein
VEWWVGQGQGLVWAGKGRGGKEWAQSKLRCDCSGADA